MTTAAAQTIAQRVTEYRARLTGPNAHLYDGNLDVAYWLVTDTPARLWSPSELGRALRIDTNEARGLLVNLAADSLITATGNGAWMKYTAA